MTENEETLEVEPGSVSFPEYYANVVRLTTNVYGASILFGKVRPADMDGDTSRMSPVCLVDISPAQAKSLFLLLREHLRNYEKEWGKIPVHKGMVEKYGDEL